MTRAALSLFTALCLTLGVAAAADGPKITPNGPAVEATSGLSIGQAPAPFTLGRLGGGQVSWPQDFAGQVTLVNIWATWCEPCIEEIPSLERLRRQLKGQPVSILTISIGEGDEAKVQELLRTSGASLPTALDPGGVLALSWGTSKVPETYIFGADGKLVEKVIAAQIWDRGDRVHQLKVLGRPAP